MSDGAKVLVAIPAFNEEECIEKTVVELESVPDEFDFIVINDGSRDATLDICRQLRCNVIDLPINCGLTVGFQTAARYAVDHGYDYMIQFDADGQHRPEYIVKLVEKALVDNADIVIGSRFLTVRKDKSLRMLGSRMITVLIKMLTGTRVSDPTSGFRLFKRSILEKFYYDNSLNPEPETIALFLKQGYSVSEVQVEMRERQGGESYLNPVRSVQYMARVFATLLIVQWFR
ncbi:glycosyltransferase family 2 protein [Collinsella sp. AM41-2BH]|uniref:glycosyltransferase family 2 protein n=1 Tax=Collinsella sp. AM41-2BH TaxID=2292320 RepID=UPI000E48DFFD|nr:glycosyltransferase family 2 protein [Collinsella sp. AM41-2BH]RHB11747.1 glycosyltransferase family 2 protein [Collinsella sp. AM41-2BH]